ncbi:MAG TPA: CaiB/BaiF CoA-transferase family protein [Candidatus Binatia bacterium]|jgi:itaconate CoA-transferase|nr:CaiB/BaiF CoA-transferase family protein [Candidatus Binatia bacterium]
MRPLDGITVIAFEHAVAAPFATRQLADLGARVIKIERPNVGDFARDYDKTVKGMSSHFVWLNRSKESLTLDLKHPRAMQILERLLERADVVIQNLAPGAARRLGLSAESLLAKYPRVIVCDLSGYGDAGPYATKKAYDLLVQSESGVLSVTGTADTPSKVGISIADIATGMYAYSGILTALYQREKSGKGTRIEVTMFEALAEWMGYPLYYTHFGGKAPARTGPDHATIVPYGRYQTVDGKSVMLGLQNEREWAVFCEKVLLQPKLAQDPRYDSNSKRAAKRAEINALITKVFATLTAEQLIERLDASGIANARMNTPDEVWEHPQLKARNRWREMDSPAGPLAMLLPPVTMPDFEARIDAVPALGEHTQSILAELGYNSRDIAALREAGVV